MNFLMTVLQASVLVLALAVDAFACSFGYGASKIKIPLKSVVVISIGCTILLGVGLFLGAMMTSILSYEAAGWIAFTILFILGVIKIFDSIIKRIIRTKNGIDTDINFSLFNLGFVLRIYADPEFADADYSKELTPKESIPLAVALGLDGLSVGIGIGLALINPLLILSLTFISGILVIIFGAWLGNKVAKKITTDLSWVAGVILIVIAVLEVL